MSTELAQEAMVDWIKKNYSNLKFDTSSCDRKVFKDFADLKTERRGAKEGLKQSEWKRRGKKEDGTKTIRALELYLSAWILPNELALVTEENDTITDITWVSFDDSRKLMPTRNCVGW